MRFPMRFLLCLSLLTLAWSASAAACQPGDLVLFDFENEADLKAWAPLDLPNAKAKEPPPRVERLTKHATSGKHSLKITFAGGRWPTLTTTAIPDDWMAYETFSADVTVERPCLVGFEVLQENSKRGGDWDESVS